MKDDLADRMYSRDESDYFEWILLGYGALDFPVYAWRDLRPSALASPLAFFLEGGFGDFRGYVLTLADLDPVRCCFTAIRAHAGDVRRAAWFNLADVSLVAAFMRITEHVITGDRQSDNPALRIGSWRVVPGAHATLTPLGLERGVDVRLVTTPYLARAGVRWIDPPAGERLWGGGVRLRSRDASRLLPEVRADLWQRPEPGLGYRVEVGARRTLPFASGRLDASLHVGYKSAGYLADAPARAGVLFGVAGAVRY